MAMAAITSPETESSSAVFRATMGIFLEQERNANMHEGSPGVN